MKDESVSIDLVLGQRLVPKMSWSALTRCWANALFLRWVGQHWPGVGPTPCSYCRQEQACDRWGGGPDAGNIIIGLMLSPAQVAGSTPALHLEMVDRHRTNVGYKQRRCVLYSDGTIIGPTLRLACCSWCDAGPVWWWWTGIMPTYVSNNNAMLIIERWRKVCSY